MKKVSLSGIKLRPRLTIGAKLLGLVTFLLVSTVSTVVFISSKLFVQDNTALIQQINSDSASHLATGLRSYFVQVADKARVLGGLLSKNQLNSETKPILLKEFFSRDRDFLGVLVYEIDDKNVSQLKSWASHPDLKTMGDESGEKALLSASDFDLKQLVSGGIQVAATSLLDANKAMLIGLPYTRTQTIEGPKMVVIVGLVKEPKLITDFADSSLVTSLLTDGKGNVIAHTDPRFRKKAFNARELPPVRKLLEGKLSNGLSTYFDPNTQERKLGAFQAVGFGGLGVVAEVPEERAFEAAYRAQYRTALVAALMLAIAIVVGILFSDTLTWPIKVLVEASHRIAQGNFAISLKSKGSDEISHLSLAFNNMAKGLAERDKAKSLLNKFKNKEIAEKMMSGEVKLGGERREAIIFFSDIRDFTSISEQLSPEEVVEMLNEYMTRMVGIIQKHHGVVDKYVGDAIMALWSVPDAREDDLNCAMKACIEMREELARLNEARIARGHHPIKIGMGLNMGPVVAGNIGSNERLDYTVIGDSVNLASRIESMTKEFGTDFLVSGAIADKVKEKFLLEATSEVKVKGKTEAMKLYQVKGYIDDNGQPIVVQTPYSSYEKSHSDKRAA